MTTLVACFSKKIMASDSNFSTPDGNYLSEKIFKMPNGSLWGVCGNDCDAAFLFIDWVMKGSNPEKKPKFKPVNDFTILEMSDSGLAVYGWTTIPQPINSDFHAIGSGAMAAKAAWFTGASVKKCVEIACKVDSDSSLPVVSMRFKGNK